jgi:hypothetical protein
MKLLHSLEHFIGCRSGSEHKIQKSWTLMTFYHLFLILYPVVPVKGGGGYIYRHAEIKLQPNFYIFWTKDLHNSTLFKSLFELSGWMVYNFRWFRQMNCLELSFFVYKYTYSFIAIDHPSINTKHTYLHPKWIKRDTSGAGTAYPSGAHEFTVQFLVGFVLLGL